MTTPRWRGRRARLAFHALLVLPLLTTACGSDDDSSAATTSVQASTTATPASDATTTPDSTPALTGFPLHLENCGFDVTLDAPPKRIFSLAQGTTETLLALGMADQMVGASGWNGSVLETLAAENAKVKSFASADVSLESILDLEPDLLITSWADTFSEESLATREHLAELGVATYISPTDCVGKDFNGNHNTSPRTRPVEAQDYFDEVTELGSVIGHPERAVALIDDLQSLLDDAAKIDVAGTSAIFWFANAEAPFIAGCCGGSGFISERLGLKNVYDDRTEEWPTGSWEVIAERNPDVFVIPDVHRGNLMSADSAQDKIAFLESNPLTREMDAVKNRRYVVVRGTSLSPPGIGVIHAVDQIAREAPGDGVGQVSRARSVAPFVRRQRRRASRSCHGGGDGERR
ncbi:MAG: ABC transporter substrate-binding protein [Ilumatobacteraceae bacterium]